MTSKSSLSLLAVLFCSLGLFACEPPPEPGEPQAPDRQQQTGQAQKMSMLAGKPGAPIEVDYELDSKPVVGQPLEITLTFRSKIPGEELSARYEVSDGSALSLLGNGDALISLEGAQDTLNHGQRSGQDSLRVIPHREGRHFVAVVVELQTDSGLMSRSISIPVNVGTGRLESSRPQEDENPSAELQADSSGESIISLPAEEGGGK